MKFRIYNKKSKTYYPQDSIFISGDNRRIYYIDNQLYGNPFVEINKADIYIEKGFESYDGSGRTFYEGDVFAVNVSGVFYPYALRFDGKGFVFKLIFKGGDTPNILMPFVSAVEHIGCVHNLKQIKERIGQLNG